MEQQPQPATQPAQATQAPRTPPPNAAPATPQGRPQRPAAPHASPRAAQPNAPQKERNVILIGKKETMAYVLAVVTQFNQGLTPVHIRARGKSIMKAADVSQIVKNRFIPTLKIERVDISTEELTAEDGHRTKVSAMDIVVSK